MVSQAIRIFLKLCFYLNCSQENSRGEDGAPCPEAETCVDDSDKGLLAIPEDIRDPSSDTAMEGDSISFEESIRRLEQLHAAGSDYHEEMMDIIRHEIENGNYAELSLMSNVNVEILCKFLIAAGGFWWLVNKPCYFNHLLYIMGDRCKECVPFFENQLEWNCMPPHHCAEIIRNILCHDHEQLKNQKYLEERDRNFLQESKCLLEKLITRAGMEPSVIAVGNTELIKCGEMISALKFFRHKSDCDQIIRRLECFPTLNDLLKKNVRNMVEKRRTNWLLRMFGGDMREGKYLHLCKIENVLRELKNKNISRRQQLVKNLKNDTQTLDTLAEIILMAILMERSFQIVKVNVDVPCGDHTSSSSKDKDFDVLAKFGNTDLYVEVLNHRNDMVAALLECVHEPKKNIGEKICDKYAKFRCLTDHTVAILAIQTESSGSEVEKFFKEQYEKKCVYEQLSAVFLFYNEEWCNLILNPNAANPLPCSMINALRRRGSPALSVDG